MQRESNSDKARNKCQLRANNYRQCQSESSGVRLNMARGDPLRRLSDLHQLCTDSSTRREMYSVKAQCALDRGASLCVLMCEC